MIRNYCAHLPKGQLQLPPLAQSPVYRVWCLRSQTYNEFDSALHRSPQTPRHWCRATAVPASCHSQSTVSGVAQEGNSGLFCLIYNLMTIYASPTAVREPRNLSTPRVPSTMAVHAAGKTRTARDLEWRHAHKQRARTGLKRPSDCAEINRSHNEKDNVVHSLASFGADRRQPLPPPSKGMS